MQWSLCGECWGRPGHRLDVLSETQQECYGATLLHVKTGTSQGKSAELRSKTILLLLKDEGRNEKGQVLKVLIDLNRFTFQPECVMKWITGTNCRDICMQKSQKSPKIARICEPDSCRKVFRSFIHCRTQWILFYTAFIHLFLNRNILSWIPCHCWPRAQSFHAFILLC